MAEKELADGGLETAARGHRKPGIGGSAVGEAQGVLDRFGVGLRLERGLPFPSTLFQRNLPMIDCKTRVSTAWFY